MRMFYAQVGAASLACSLLLAVVPDTKAAERQQPIPLYASGRPAGPSPGAVDPSGAVATCPAPSPLAGPVVPGRLVIRNTDRPDVGPYTVTLPGYAADAASDTADSYQPFLIALARQRINVLWAMLTHDQAYDPDRRAA